MHSIEWWHFQWPWRTANSVFKVTAFLKSINSKLVNRFGSQCSWNKLWNWMNGQHWPLPESLQALLHPTVIIVVTSAQWWSSFRTLNGSYLSTYLLPGDQSQASFEISTANSAKVTIRQTPSLPTTSVFTVGLRHTRRPRPNKNVGTEIKKKHQNTECGRSIKNVLNAEQKLSHTHTRPKLYLISL